MRALRGKIFMQAGGGMLVRECACRAGDAGGIASAICWLPVWSLPAKV